MMMLTIIKERIINDNKKSTFGVIITSLIIVTAIVLIKNSRNNSFTKLDQDNSYMEETDSKEAFVQFENSGDENTIDDNAIDDNISNVNISDKNNRDDIINEDGEQEVSPSLGGITLGDTFDKVTSLLGDQYKESKETDELGVYGEDIIILSYDNGITVRLGKTTGKVISVISSSSNFQTDLGIKVGDNKETLYDKYSQFEEAFSRHSEVTLKGWFLVNEETVIIFHFDDSDYNFETGEIHPGAKVVEIELAFWKHFD